MLPVSCFQASREGGGELYPPEEERCATSMEGLLAIETGATGCSWAPSPESLPSPNEGSDFTFKVARRWKLKNKMEALFYTDR